MKVLVTGHNGYIGTVLVPMLLAEGHEAVGMDANWFAACTFGEEPVSIAELNKDIRDAELRDLQGFDAVVDLANLSNDPLGNLNPELTFEINYRGSVRLAMLAKEAGVERYVFSSSCSTYGAAGTDYVTEEADFNPVTPYGRAKVLVEQEVSKLADDSFAPIYMRNATAYGVSPRLRFDLVLNNLVAWAYTTGRIYIKSDGTPWRPIVHIEDISRAFIAALNAPLDRIRNHAFNVGRTDENYQIRDLAEIVKETVPGCRVEYAEGAEPDKRSYRVDFAKITTVLPEFVPQWDARRGARELLDAYRKAGLQRGAFEGPRYQRIRHVKELIRTGRLGTDLRWVRAESSSAAA